MSTRAVLISYDASLAKTLSLELKEEGYDCYWTQNTEDLERQAAPEGVDIILYDHAPPGIDGIAQLKKIRAGRIGTPVILLTAANSIHDRVEGLRAGADDCVAKPFAMSELVARIVAVMRRWNRIEGPVLNYGPLRLELTTRRAFREDRELRLSPTEMSLLELLLRRSENVVTRQMLCEQLWDSSWEGETNVIEVHINRLRGKVDRSFGSALIHTVRGQGYMLSQKVKA